MKAEDRELFMKYALPCADFLVKRGEITQESVDRLIKKISNNEKIPKGSEKMFKVAYAMCIDIKEKLKKKGIDSDIIRRYFLYEHDKVVDENLSEDRAKCKVWPGRVFEVRKNFAKVFTPLGKCDCRTDFVKDLKKDDFVSVHRGFIIEKITKELAKEMWELKERSLMGCCQ